MFYLKYSSKKILLLEIKSYVNRIPLDSKCIPECITNHKCIYRQTIDIVSYYVWKHEEKIYLKGADNKLISRRIKYRNLFVLGICCIRTSTIRLSTGTYYKASQENYCIYNGIWQRCACCISCLFLNWRGI